MHGMCNICNIRLPQTMGDVISSISIGTAVADSIGYRAPAWYRSNPSVHTFKILQDIGLARSVHNTIIEICVFYRQHAEHLPLGDQNTTFLECF